MLTAIIVFLLVLAFLFVGVIFIAALPVALFKHATTKKQPCPKCENMIRFIANYGKCPKCRAKIYRHGDGTLRLREW